MALLKPSFIPGAEPAPGVCPACASDRVTPFYEQRGIPTVTTLLIPSREEARAYPTGDILLCFCEQCGFISNLLFDPELTEYSERYEGTQNWSPTFDAYHRELARDLIERHDLHGRRIVEIGCGQGEFLRALCELGDNEGLGFDPAVRPETVLAAAGTKLDFVQDFYSEAYSETDADFYCCKMTLEHIHDVGRFARMLRKSIADQPDAIVFIQVPESGLILRQAQFYDVLYEHCSYHTPASIERLFALAGFAVTSTRIQYGGQHLSLEARAGIPRPSRESVEEVRELCMSFAERCAGEVRKWSDRLERTLDAGKQVVLWGSGSKATGFLTTLGIEDEIPCVVDVNPRREGMYLAGSGHRIVSPEALRELSVDLVIIVNPIYREEIQTQLASMDLHPELVALSA